MSALAVAAGTFGISVPAASAATGYAPTATIGVGTNPGSVGIDPSDHVVYVGNISDATVSVISGGAVTATIPVGADPLGIAVDSSTHSVYVASSGGTVSVINGGAVTATIAVGGSPQSVAVDPSTHTAYVTDQLDDAVWVINGGAVAATLGVGHSPSGVAVDPTTGTVYVANFGSSTVSVIEANKVTATIPVGLNPTGVAVDPSSHMVYVASEDANELSVIRGDAVIHTIPVLPNPDGVAVDPSTHTAYVSNSSVNGTVSVIRHGRLVAAVQTGHGPLGVAVDPSLHTAYAANEGQNTVSVISSEIPSTATEVTCSPRLVVATTTCTATVSGSRGTALTGAVNFTSGGPGTFGAGGQCTLTVLSAGTATCQVAYTPSGPGSGAHAITGAYGGDSTHAASIGSTTVHVPGACRMTGLGGFTDSATAVKVTLGARLSTDLAEPQVLEFSYGTNTFVLASLGSARCANDGTSGVDGGQRLNTFSAQGEGALAGSSQPLLVQFTLTDGARDTDTADIALYGGRFNQLIFQAQGTLTSGLLEERDGTGR